MNQNLSEEQQKLVDLLIMELMKRCQVSGFSYKITGYD